ncbi:MAG: leucine--tRNA ligase [Gemmatimonadota bacterium]|nr:leucine--tRNA ligase [Gemmatimonadota bacterium]
MALPLPIGSPAIQGSPRRAMANQEQDGYQPSTIEEKWQRRWEERGTNAFTTDELRSADQPFYNLMMFPYPSAEGLHVGNIYAFTGADVYGRYQRLRGRTVFEPIGFDAFGIHSENFALKVGTHPMDLIPSNVANFTRQLRRIGGMFDWTHTVDTTDPAYYEWTQWIFLQLYEAGLAERKEAPVNWCPSCMTVLANEQVGAGACERCGTPVEQRRIAQWFFKITEYAERLLDNLEELDWSETTRKAQANWIGRSEGAQLHFPVLDEQGANTDDTVEVYTTRPDTIFGATYMVLAPEHPLVDAVTRAGQAGAVDAYRVQARKKDLVARQKDDRTKTGVFTGGYCRNPATGRAVPVWVADYVLMDYGTGAIMAVPGHDERDFEFARTFDLPIVRVVAGPDENADTPLEEAYVGPGRLVNSGELDGTDVSESVSVATEWAAKQGWAEARVQYRLHDWCISRQRYWGPPIPIVHCPSCGAVPVPEDELPVVLPRVEDFKPDDTGVSPMARVESWYETSCPACGGDARRETDVSDTFLDSSWYFLRYPSTDFDDRPFDPEITKQWLPVDTYIGGNEHAVLHLMYARFITMVLKDLGHIDFEEPFTQFRAHGLIIAEGAKMSKSKGNVIVPDPIIEEYGADTFRTYLMFLGPFEEGGDYRAEGIQGPHGFLHRMWDTAVSADPSAPPDPEVERKVHQTIKQVSEQIPELGYNTAIAALMECLNSVRAGGRTAARAEVEPLVVMVAPFAPHMAEELWEQLGHEESIFDGAHWPSYDDAKLAEDTVTVAVQVNGKLRGSIDVPKDAPEPDVVAAARGDENVARHLEGAAERRVIYVKERLINFVVE